MARRTILAAALCALAAAISPTASFAHAGNPNMESLVRAITPSIPGFSVNVLNGDDRLEVINKGSQTVTIYGYNKEPYVRMTPDGKVVANVRSPAYYLNQDRYFGAKVPPIANEHAAPQWKVVSLNGRYQFHDHRIHYMATNTPPSVKNKSKRQKVFDWQVPLRVGSTTGSINGTLFWRGSSGGPPAAAFIAFALIALLGAASVVIVRRRRGDGGPGPGSKTDANPASEAW